MTRPRLTLALALSLLPACFTPDASPSMPSDTDGEAATDPDLDPDAPADAATEGDGPSAGSSSTGASPEPSDPDQPEPADPGSDPEETGGEADADTDTDTDGYDPGGTDTDAVDPVDPDPSGGSTGGEPLIEPEVVELGYADPFADIGGVSGFLYGFPVEVDSDGTLTHFGFVAAGEGAGIQMALYSDLGGEPNTLVAASAVLASYQPGTHELDAPPVALPVGTYWLMATLGYPRRIAADLNGGQVNFPVAGITHDFPNPLPVTLDPTPFVNFRPNFFVGVLQ